MRPMTSTATHRKTALLAGTVLFLGLVSPAFSKMYRVPVSFNKQTGALATVDFKTLPAVDNEALSAAADSRASALSAAPYEIALPREVLYDLATAGTWEILSDGSRLWRLRVSSPGSLHTSLGFSHFDLPEGAALWIYSYAGDGVGEDGEAGAYVEGPFTSEHRSSSGRLFTPVVLGDTVVIELHVPLNTGPLNTGPVNTRPLNVQGNLDVRINRVHHGFRGFTEGETQVGTKISGSCNNDVICPEGDPWREQIRSVARYTINGQFLCTGQLVNNTAQDDTPYFLSAFHCGVDANNDDTVVIYWNYESPVCGQRGGGSLENNQTGVTFRASEVNIDFLLFELNQSPDPAYNVFFTGWDVSGQIPQSSVGIHHPAGDVKAISFNDDVLGMGQWIEPNTHWVVDNWEDGTTEGGSSGSCLWDPSSKLCVGVLTAGLASCQVIDFDIYGKLSLAWDVGSDASGRLMDWLDPLGLGGTTLQGKDPGAAGDCVPSDTVLCLQNRRFQVEVSRTGAEGPGPGKVVPVSNRDSGIFYFFTDDNWEMLLKVLDGCSITNHFWFFAASATSVEWTITVTDTQEGVSKQYTHAAGTPSPAITDTAAFATCP